MPQISTSAFANAVANRVSSPTRATNGNPIKYDAQVAENNTLTDNTKLYVYPIGLLPLVTPGVLRDNPIPIKRSFTDAKGRSVVAKGNHGSTLLAYWFNRDGTRTTAPQVQRGEIVDIWQESDTGIWRWEERNDAAKTSRRQETVIHSVNADKPDGPDSDKHDSSNTYYTEMSAHNKSYTVGMSKANGEVAGYKFQMNGEKGAIVLQDDKGNYVEIFTTDSRIVIHNAMDTYIELIGNNINVHCNEHVKMKVGGNMDIEVSGDVSLKASNVNIKADKVTVDSPQTTFTGSVNIEKGLSVTGSSTMGGGGTVRGQLTVEGTHTVTGAVRLNGGTSNGLIRGSYD